MTSYAAQLSETLLDNDESPCEVVDSIIEHWSSHGLACLAIIAPDPRSHDNRRTVICRPDHFQTAADTLAQSDAYGPSWRTHDYTNVVVVDTSRDEPWIEPWRKNGVSRIVRFAKDLPLGKQLEIYAGFSVPVERPDANAFVTYLAASSARLRNRVMIPMSGLSLQKVKVLALSMTGMSAKDCAVHMGVTERTVNHHLTEVSLKLGSQNKIDSITRAIWIGVL